MARNDDDMAPAEKQFIPGFKSIAEYVKTGYGYIMGGCKSSNAIGSCGPPTASYLEVTSQMKDNAVFIFNSILRMQNIQKRKSDPNFGSLAEMNDTLIDSLNEDIQKFASGDTSTPAQLPKASIASWNTKPIVSLLQMGKMKMLAAKNVERPQLSFKDPVDNSTKTFWTPKLVDKPNNLKPLALDMIYNNNGDPIGYAHPYEIELEQFEPHENLLKEDTVLTLPQPLEGTKMIHVQTEADLQKLIKHLRTVKEIAVDVEHHNYRTYLGITCLLQITTEEGGDFLVDTLTLREHLHLLNEIFTNPKILKVLHGADSDIIWLQRDLGIYVVGMFDTHVAALLLEHHKVSLQALLLKYCNQNLDKKHQLADWRIRPLPEELCEYARADTHFLLYIWKRMKQDLLEVANGRTNLLQAVFTKSKSICAKTYIKPTFYEDGYMDLYLKARKNFNRKQLAALKSIYQWRDGIARIEDEGLGYVLPNHMMMQIAESLPREMQGLLSCCNPIPPLLKRNLLAIHQMVLNARDNVMLAPGSSSDMPPASSNVNGTQGNASLLDFVHDKLTEFREGQDVYFKNIDCIQRRKRVLHRKVNSFEVPPKKFKDFNTDSITKTFVSPFERYQLLKDYQIPR